MRPVDSDPSKINQPNSQSMNAQGMEEQTGAAYHPNPLLATRSSDLKWRLKQGAARCGSSSFDRSACLEGLTVELEELFYKKGNTARIISQVYCAKNEMPSCRFENETQDRADEAGQKRRCVLQILCRPFPRTFAQCFQGIFITPITAPMTVPPVRTIAVTVNPYFFTPSKSGRLFAFSAISVSPLHTQLLWLRRLLFRRRSVCVID